MSGPAVRGPGPGCQSGRTDYGFVFFDLAGSCAASGVIGDSAGNDSRGLLVDFQSDPKQTRQ